MSDPYLPPNPLSANPTTAPRLSPRPPGDDYSRTNVRIEPGPPVAVRSDSGFGTGLMVALVFVVVALLAYALVGNREDAAPVSPELAIENDGSPEADVTVPDAVAPDAVAPDAVAPDATAPDVVAPDTGTADPVTPAPDAAPAAPANP